jgi:hypothetical protein
MWFRQSSLKRLKIEKIMRSTLWTLPAETNPGVREQGLSSSPPRPTRFTPHQLSASGRMQVRLSFSTLAKSLGFLLWSRLFEMGSLSSDTDLKISKL